VVRKELFVYLPLAVTFSECQTDEDENLVERLLAENKMLRSMLIERPELDVQLLENNDRLTRFYTGMPIYDSFLALVEFLTLKAKVLRAWKGSSTPLEEKQWHGSQWFGGLSIANQLFAILARLRLALPITDVCTHLEWQRELTVECLQHGFASYLKSFH